MIATITIGKEGHHSVQGEVVTRWSWKTVRFFGIPMWLRLSRDITVRVGDQTFTGKEIERTER